MKSNSVALHWETMVLRYSATHKVEHNKVYRLDALDAFNQKLVKKIQVRRKAAYTVHFESAELVEKCVLALDRELRVTPLQYTVQQGEQTATAS